MKFGIGQALTRVEDQRFLTGRGRFATDARAAGQLHAYVLRSPHAHASFRFTDLATARAMPGVHLVLTAEDVAELGDLPLLAPTKTIDGTSPKRTRYPVLPDGVVRHVGDAVAFVVADTLERARDAAEAIGIQWAPMPAAHDIASARKPGAPLVHAECPGNIAYESLVGEKDKTEAIFKAAPRVIGLDIANNRIIANYMETRSILAEPDGERLTLTLGTQGSHGIRDNLARNILKIDPSLIRVITPDVGGGFGTKTFMYREYPLVAHAARLLGRPVFWQSDRSEHFLTCAHGRDNLARAEMAVDEAGRFLAMRVFLDANMGAYLSQYSTFIPWIGSTMLTGCYRIPSGYVHIRGLYSHTVPTDAYRGAGRPEAAYVVERLVDFIADTLGIDRIALRRQNLIRKSEMPYKTTTGRVYDSGDFAGHMKAAMELGDWKGFPARWRAARRKGKLRGIGLGVYIEACGGGSPEPGFITLEKDGTATVRIGTQSNGQGHETAYAQLAAEHLDLPLEKIRVLQGDTNELPAGGGTGGSRSIPVGGAAVAAAAEALARNLKTIAAKALEAGEGDLEIRDGMVRIAGTDRAIAFADLAKRPEATSELLKATGKFAPPEATYPNGTHLCEVEIDPETGETAILNYQIVDDFGVTVNPLLLLGQIHGGAVQGIGQALMEDCVYDASGQLLSATPLDYALPHAADMPGFKFETRNVPCRTNPLGVKGAGEAGTIGAAPAVMNAVIDALRREKGIQHLDMPATPRRIWEALHGKA